MRKTLMVTTLCALCGLAQPLAQQDDPNLKMLRRIYSKLTQMFTVSGSMDGFQPGSSVLLLLNPGIFVDPSLDVSTPQGRLGVSMMLNRVPKPAWLYEETGQTVSQVYERVMDDAEVLTTPPGELDLAKLAGVEAYLFAADGEPSARYARYLKEQEAYYTAFARCEEARGSAPACSAQLRAARDAALARWEAVGRRNEVEGKLQEFHQLTQTGQAWFQRLRTKFTAGAEQADGIEFHRVLTYPSYPKWSDNEGWSKYTLTDVELEEQRESSRVTSGGGGSVSFGLFSIGGSSYKSEGKSYGRSKTSGITIEVEIKRVTMLRPWLNRIVLDSDRWRFGAQTASSGLFISKPGSGAQPPTGLMPLYTTGLLLARNVRIRGLDANEVQTHYDKQEQTGGSVGWGPFRLGGHRSSNETQDYRHARKIENGLAYDDPQIIGFYGETLGLSPRATTAPVPVAGSK